MCRPFGTWYFLPPLVPPLTRRATNLPPLAGLRMASHICHPFGTNGNGSERRLTGLTLAVGMDKMASGHVLQPEGKKLDVLTWPAP